MVTEEAILPALAFRDKIIFKILNNSMAWTLVNWNSDYN